MDIFGQSGNTFKNTSLPTQRPNLKRSKRSKRSLRVDNSTYKPKFSKHHVKPRSKPHVKPHVRNRIRPVPPGLIPSVLHNTPSSSPIITTADKNATFFWGIVLLLVCGITVLLLFASGVFEQGKDDSPHDTLEFQLKKIYNALANHLSRLNGHEERLDEMDTQFVHIDDVFAVVGARLNALETAGSLGGLADGMLWNDAETFAIATIDDGLSFAAGSMNIDFNTTNLKITASQINTIQNIDSTATPTFTGLTLSGLTEGIAYVNASDVIATATAGNGIDYTLGTVSVDFNTTNLKITASQINTIQNIDTGASPTFTGLTLSGLTEGIVYVNASDVIATATAGNGIDYTTGTISVDYNTTNLKITGVELDTIQDIDSTATPQWARVGIGAAANGNAGLLIATGSDSSTTANSGYLLIGDPAFAHLTMDDNEIIAKSSSTAFTTLYLNGDGGLVSTGSGGITTSGDITTSAGNLIVSAGVVTVAGTSEDLLTLTGTTASDIGFISSTATTHFQVGTSTVHDFYIYDATNTNYIMTMTDGGSSVTTFNYDVTIGGNLTVNGTSVTLDASTVVIEDSMIKLASGNTSNITDFGVYGLYSDDGGTTDEFAGIFFDATDNTWTVFHSLEDEPGTTVDIGGTGYALSDFKCAGLSSSGLTISGLTASRLVATDGSKNLASVSDFTSWIADSGTGNISVAASGGGVTLNTAQDILTSSSPTFGGLTLTGKTSLIYANTGVLTDVALGDGVQFSAGTLSVDFNTTNLKITGVELDTIQGIATTSSPTFVDITLSALTFGSPTYSTVQQYLSTAGSSGVLTGFTITRGTSEFSVSSGSVYIRATDDDLAPLLSADVSALATTAIADQQTLYVGVQYNGGTPEIFTQSTEAYNYNTTFPLYTVYNHATHLHSNETKIIMGNHASLLILKDTNIHGFVRDTKVGGLVLSNTGTRNLVLTAGVVWEGLVQHTISAVDTSGVDSFTSHYYTGAAWVHTTTDTQWDNTQYNDILTGLVTLGNNKYANHWVYIETTGGIITTYGQAEFGSLAEALEESPPSVVTGHIEINAMLVARLTFKKNDATPQNISSAFDTEFVSSVATAHNDLANLQGGTADEYYHLTNAAYLNLYQQDQEVLIASTPQFARLGIGAASDAVVGLVVDAGTEVDLDAADAGYIRIGNSTAATHMIIDQNEIQVKDTATTTGSLYLNAEGGHTQIGDGTSAGRLGIGTIAPDTFLHILAGSAGAVASVATADMTVENSSTTGLQFLVPGTGGAGTESQFIWFGDLAANDVGYIEYDHVDNSLSIVVAATEAIGVDSSQNVTMPSGNLDITGTLTCLTSITVNAETMLAASFVQLNNIEGKTVNATQWGYLGAMNQDVHTSASPTFADLILATGSDTTLLINSGIANHSRIHFGDAGDTDIGYIDYYNNDNSLSIGVNASEAIGIDSSQNVTMPAGNLTVSGNISTTSGTIGGLTSAELTQLQNIDSSEISTTEWGYVATMQDVKLTAGPQFQALNVFHASSNAVVNFGVSSALITLGYAYTINQYFSGVIAGDAIWRVTNSANNIYIGVGTAAELKITNGIVYVVGALSVSGNISTTSGTIGGLSSTELTQLQNIDSSEISTTEWGYVATMQDIATSASPTFVGATFSGLTASKLVGTNGSKVLESVTLQGTSNQITVSGTSTITLATPQDIATSSSVQFGALTLSTAVTSQILIVGNSTAADAGTDETAEIHFGLISGETDNAKIVVGKDSDYQSAANKDSHMKFYVDFNETSTLAMTIDSSQNVTLAGSNLSLGGNTLTSTQFGYYDSIANDVTATQWSYLGNATVTNNASAVAAVIVDASNDVALTGDLSVTGTLTPGILQVGPESGHGIVQFSSANVNNVEALNLLNSTTASGGVTTHSVSLDFGFGGDDEVGRILVGKTGDYVLAADKDSFMTLYVDQNGSLVSGLSIASDQTVTVTTLAATTITINTELTVPYVVDASRIAYINSSKELVSMGDDLLTSFISTPGASLTTASNGAGGVTISIAQSIATSGTPQFERVGVSCAADSVVGLVVDIGTGVDLTVDAGYIRVGDSTAATHMIMDQNEIQVKATATTAGALSLNAYGGLVSIGSGGLDISGILTCDTSITVNAETMLAASFVELNNIAGLTVSATQWGYLGAMNQNVITSSSPTFANLTLTTAADTTLQITSGAANNSIINFGDSVDTNIGFIDYDNVDDSFSIATNTVEAIGIDNSQNVTIPSGNLSITGTLSVTGDVTTTSKIWNGAYFNRPNAGTYVMGDSAISGTTTHSIYIGDEIGDGTNSSMTGSYNIVMGNKAGYELEASTNCIFFGRNSGWHCHNITDCIFLGAYAGENHAISGGGDDCIAIGTYALRTNASGTASGTNIVALGHYAGEYGSWSAKSTFIGSYCGASTAANTVYGSYNTGCGYSAIRNMITGAASNSAFGSNAGENLTTGTYNLFLGRASGDNLTTGDNCIAIGSVNFEEIAVDSQFVVGNQYQRIISCNMGTVANDTMNFTVGNQSVADNLTSIFTVNHLEELPDGTTTIRSCITLAPEFTSTTDTLTDFNYFTITRPGLTTTTITNSYLHYFPAAAGTHEVVDSGSTKTSPGTVSAWIKIDINGTAHYMPCYASKTS